MRFTTKAERDAFDDERFTAIRKPREKPVRVMSLAEFLGERAKARATEGKAS